MLKKDSRVILRAVLNNSMKKLFILCFISALAALASPKRDQRHRPA